MLLEVVRPAILPAFEEAYDLFAGLFKVLREFLLCLKAEDAHVSVRPLLLAHGLQEPLRIIAVLFYQFLFADGLLGTPVSVKVDVVFHPVSPPAELSF